MLLSSISCCLTTLLLLPQFINGADLIGDNVCQVERMKEVTVKEPYNHTYPYQHQKACLDPTQGFSCKETRYHTRVLYRDVIKKEPYIADECCEGYVQHKQECIPVCTNKCLHGTCVAPGVCKCANGYTGLRCQTPPTTTTLSTTTTSTILTNDRNYTTSAAISNTIIMQSASASVTETTGWPASSIILLILGMVALSLLLIALVFYYRRKYMREKDPELPVVTYNSDDEKNAAMNGIYGASAADSNEFDNPLYASPTHKSNNGGAALQGYMNPLAGVSAVNNGRPTYTVPNAKLKAVPPPRIDDGNIYETTDSMRSGSSTVSENHYSSLPPPPYEQSVTAQSNEYEIPESVSSAAAQSPVPTNYSSNTTVAVAPSTASDTQYERLAV